MLKKILSYSVALYAVAILASILRVVVKSLIAKTIGKEALGAYAYYMTVITLGSSLLAFGIRRAITKQVASSKVEGQFAPIIVAVMAIGVAASIGLAALGVFLSQFIDWIYVLILLSVGPFTLFEIARATMRGQFDQKREIILAFLAVVTQAAFVILIIQISSSTYAPVLAITIANIFLAVGIAIYFLRRYKQHWKPGNLLQAVQSTGFRSLLLLSAPLWVTDVLGIIGTQADQLIVQGQLGFGALAEYAAAFTFIGLLDQPITVMSRVFLVTFSGGYYNDFHQYKQVSSLNMAFFSVLGFMVMVISVPLTPLLFTNAYTMVPLLVTILSMSSIFNSVEVLNTSLTIAIDYPKANRDSKIWTTILYIPVMFLLVSRFGVIGAAVSNVLSWGAYALVHAFYMRRRLPQHASHTFRMLTLGTGLYMAAIWTAYLLNNVWLALFILIIYLGIGHLLHLWDLTYVPVMIRRLLPERFKLQPAVDQNDH